MSKTDMALIISKHHVLCGTCVNEHKHKKGYFESSKRRAQVGVITELSAEQVVQDESQVYCCNCGQKSYIAATFEMEPAKTTSDGPCNGIHESIDA